MSKYPEQFKLTVVQAYLQGSNGLRKIAQQFGVDVSLLRRWAATYQQHGSVNLRTRGQR
ncbi:transposase, partial [Klebsiella pneumoniae]|nr:transposase [Klebsiella pneumoniae]